MGVLLATPRIVRKDPRPCWFEQYASCKFSMPHVRTEAVEFRVLGYFGLLGPKSTLSDFGSLLCLGPFWNWDHSRLWAPIRISGHCRFLGIFRKVSIVVFDLIINKDIA